MNHICVACSALLGMLLALGVAQTRAESVYKWIDEKGVVNYSSAAPAANAKGLQKTMIDAAPPVVSRAGDGREIDAYALRINDEKRLVAMRDDRLRRELIEAQIATEEARRDQLRSQAEAYATRSQADQARADCQRNAATDCQSDYGFAFPYVRTIVVVPVNRAPHMHRSPIPFKPREQFALRQGRLEPRRMP